MKYSFRRFWQTAKYLLFQEKCRACGYLMHPRIAQMNYERFRPPAQYTVADLDLISDSLCQACWMSLEEQLPVSNLKPVFVVSGTHFADKMKELIYKFKYDQDQLLAQDLGVLAFKGWSKLQNHIDPKIAYFVPVPLHWTRIRERGFNQSESIAKYLSKLTGIKLTSKAIKRIKKTISQRELRKEKRLANVINAFKADEKIVAGKQIILVDDVCTSGATLLGCAKALRQAGAEEVFALTVAVVDKLI